MLNIAKVYLVFLKVVNNVYQTLFRESAVILLYQVYFYEEKRHKQHNSVFLPNKNNLLFKRVFVSIIT